MKLKSLMPEAKIVSVYSKNLIGNKRVLVCVDGNRFSLSKCLSKMFREKLVSVVDLGDYDVVLYEKKLLKELDEQLVIFQH